MRLPRIIEIKGAVSDPFSLFLESEEHSGLSDAQCDVGAVFFIFSHHDYKLISNGLKKDSIVFSAEIRHFNLCLYRPFIHSWMQCDETAPIIENRGAADLLP